MKATLLIGSLFIAGDDAGTTLCFSPKGNNWMIEQTNVGLVDQITDFSSAFAAFIKLSKRASTDVIVGENPYYDGDNDTRVEIPTNVSAGVAQTAQG